MTKDTISKDRSYKTVEIKIKVFKDCGTCKHICFLENLSVDVPEIAKCEIFNKTVAIEEKKKGIVYDNTECAKWEFDTSLLEDCSSFLDLGDK